MENDTTIKLSSGSCFAQHNMFLCENGDLFAFGKNDFGQCGVGSTDDLKTPTKVMNNPNIVSIQLGLYHSLILESNGDLYVCGLNMNSEFGSQHDSTITKFVKIAEKVKKVRASKFTIIQTFDDKLFFIGLFLEELHTTFTQINIEDVKSFYVGSDHCFFLRENGEIYVLGSNSSGQIGLGYESYAYLPKLITTNKNIVTICCGYEHTVIVSRGVEGVQLVCLGNNYDGELGFLDKANQFDPVTIVAHPDVKAIHCGNNHTIILKKNGTVFSTGVNEDGQLCLGNTKNVSQYTKIDLSDIESIASGSHHSMFLNEKGELFVCGSNEYGQLGLGDNENRSSPTPLKLENKIKLLNNFEYVVHVHEPTDEDNEENKN